MFKSETQLYKFGAFHLDTLKRVLFHDNTRIQLPSRAFDVLLALVEHNHSVIDKEELIQLVWGERAVEENNLTRHISTLRKVFDESPSDHRYIVTVPGRGYSFVADVERLPGDGKENGSGKQNGKVPGLGPGDGNGFESVTALDNPGSFETAAIAAEPLRPAATAHNYWPGAMALVVVLACLGLLTFGLLRTRSKPGPVNSYRDWEVVRLTRTAGSIIPAISRDGRFVAYVNRDSGRESVSILQLATSTNQQIIPPEKFAYLDLDFSPDGSELFFTRAEEGQGRRLALYRIPLLGGIARKLRDDVDSPITVSPDGTHLAFVRLNKEGKSELIIASVDGVEERVLLDHRVQFPEWSPDGKVIVYSVGSASSGGDNMSIHEVRVADGAKKEISSRRWVFVGNKSWLPDGSGLIVSGRQQKSSVTQLWLVSYPSGDARQLSDSLDDDFIRARLTDNGRVMVAEQVRSVSDIWIGPLADAGQVRKIGVWGRAGLAFAAGRGVVYSSLQSGELGKIWTMNADGTNQKQLTSDDANDAAPVTSPDGRYIVFCSNRSGHNEIWRVNYDGSNLIQLTHTEGAIGPSISSDGTWVIYLASDGTLNKVPIEGGECQPVAQNAIGASAVSPNGNLIAYFAQGEEAWEIAVKSFENGSLIRRFALGSLSLNNRSLKWTPDGKGLLFAASANGVGNIWMQALDGSAPNQVTDFKGDGIFSFDISRDGKEIVCARGGWKHDIVLIKNLR